MFIAIASYYNLIVFSLISSFVKDKKINILSSLFVFSFVAFFSVNSSQFFVPTDLVSYKVMYDNMPTAYAEINFQRVEPLFSFFMITAKKFEFEFELFIALYQLCFLFFVFLGVMKHFKYFLLPLLLLVTSSIFFNFSVNIIRQALAFSVLFLFLFDTKVSKRKFIIVTALGVLIHISFLFAAIVVLVSAQVKLRPRLLLFLLNASIIFFFINISSIIYSLISFIPDAGPLVRLVQNISNQDSPETRGRIYYAVTFLCLSFILMFYKKISNASLQKIGVERRFLDKLLMFVLMNLTLYPIFMQVGYLVRLVNYGVVFYPLLIYIIGCLFVTNPAFRAIFFAVYLCSFSAIYFLTGGILL